MGKESRIVLIQLGRRIARGMRLFSSELKKERFSPHLIFFEKNSGRDVEKLVQLLKGLNPLLVGLSVDSFHYKVAKEISRAVNRELETFLIWGPSPHALP